MTFDGHTLVNGSGFGVSQLKPNTGTRTDVRVSIYAEDAANDPNGTSDYTPGDITDNQVIDIESVTIQQINSSGIVVNEIDVAAGDETNHTLGGRVLNFNWGGTDDNDWVIVTNLGTQYRVLVNGVDDYNQMLVENVGSGNEGFDISGIVINQQDAGDPVHMDFDVRLFDGDSDPKTAQFGVTLAPPDLNTLSSAATLAADSLALTSMSAAAPQTFHPHLGGLDLHQEGFRGMSWVQHDSLIGV